MKIALLLMVSPLLFAGCSSRGTGAAPAATAGPTLRSEQAYAATVQAIITKMEAAKPSLTDSPADAVTKQGTWKVISGEVASIKTPKIAASCQQSLVQSVALYSGAADALVRADQSGQPRSTVATEFRRGVLRGSNALVEVKVNLMYYT